MSRDPSIESESALVSQLNRVLGCWHLGLSSPRFMGKAVVGREVNSERLFDFLVRECLGH